ncbi:MAG: biotin synthase BioB [Endomicrobiaceae bacterium]|nr:biotin synthase BioB [Endomicrobiaceae bacterium]
MLKLKQKILNGYKIAKNEALDLVSAKLDTLCKSANEIRQKFCGNSFDVCSIVNGKSGKCSENCKYCAQSVHYKTQTEEYPLINTKKIINDAISNQKQGILRFSVVTSGKNLTDTEIDKICKSYKKLSQTCSINLCASHGLLSYEQLIKLKPAGISRYHCNIETSKKYFHNICTSHTYEDKINTIKNAQKAGLEVCSGCIIGMGETISDRIDMFFDLRKLGIKSVPVNVLNPIKGTPFENLKVLSSDEICRTIAIARFILPDVALRLAGGRGLFKDKGKKMFMSGANATISGDMLTTVGISFEKDKKLIKSLGFEIKPI